MKFKPYPKYKASGVDWLGEVPSTWDAKPLKRMTSVNDDVLPESTDPDDEIDYVDISSVSLEAGIRNVESIKFSAAPSRARRRVCDGDVIVSTVRTYLKAIAPIRSPASNLIVSTGFAVIRPRDHFHPDFARYSMQAGYFIEDVIARSTGISYPAINATELVAIKVAVPPISEQGAISLFLDRETAKLDTLISKQERLIELLQEKRQAMISHAVTKGLPLHGRGWSKTGGGTNSEVPMKDSGIEWLGMVPEHWKVMPVKRLLEFVTSGSRGWAEYYADDGELFLRIGNLTRDTIDLDLSDLQFVHAPSGSEGDRSQVRVGDLLISITADLGSVAVVPNLPCRAYVSQHVALARIIPNVHPRWLGYVMLGNSTKTQLSVAGYGGTKIQLSLGDVRNVGISIPPASEQIEIADYLDGELTKFEALMIKSRRNIALMREHRTALISAAVTGKIDVRGELTNAAH